MKWVKPQFSASQTSERELYLKENLNKVPQARRIGFKRAYAGDSSPRMAIRAKCHECCGHEDSVKRIKACDCYGCPLWYYRPL